MAAAFLRAGAELRARLRSWVGLTVLIGLAAGAVLAAVGGGRRTDSAYDRFARAHRAADVVVFPPFSADFAPVDLAAVARLPEVGVAATVNVLSITEPDLSLWSSADPGYGTAVNRPKLLQGRMPSPDRPDEATIAFPIAERRGLGIGSRLTVHVTYSYEPSTTAPALPPEAVTLRVVGIEASPGEFPPLAGFNSDNVHVSPLLVRSLRERWGAYEAMFVRIRGGPAAVAAFQAGVRRLAGSRPSLDEALAPQAATSSGRFISRRWRPTWSAACSDWCSSWWPASCSPARASGPRPSTRRCGPSG